MATIEEGIYTFDELSDDAKERAREWWREGEARDFDPDYERFETAAKILGIEFKDNPIQTLGGKMRHESAIYWSGFSSQGDGASFEGSFSPKHSSIAVREEFGDDPKLFAIADGLTNFHCRYILLRGSRDWSAKIIHTGREVHKYSMGAEVEEMEADLSDEFLELMRDFAQWIYDGLESEYDWRMSDEAVDDSITANEYEFTEEGERA